MVQLQSPVPQPGTSWRCGKWKSDATPWWICLCLVFTYNSFQNGTWYFVEVQAKPRFDHHPDPVVYVSLHDSTVLACTVSFKKTRRYRSFCLCFDVLQAVGNPPPEIIWFKGENPVKESSRVAVVNSNTELRISNIRESDLGQYTCVARNGLNNISFTTRVVLAGEN